MIPVALRSEDPQLIETVRSVLAVNSIPLAVFPESAIEPVAAGLALDTGSSDPAWRTRARRYAEVCLRDAEHPHEGALVLPHAAEELRPPGRRTGCCAPASWVVGAAGGVGLSVRRNVGASGSRGGSDERPCRRGGESGAHRAAGAGVFAGSAVARPSRCGCGARPSHRVTAPVGERAPPPWRRPPQPGHGNIRSGTHCGGTDARSSDSGSATPRRRQRRDETLVRCRARGHHLQRRRGERNAGALRHAHYRRRAPRCPRPLQGRSQRGGTRRISAGAGADVHASRALPARGAGTRTSAGGSPARTAAACRPQHA